MRSEGEVFGLILRIAEGDERVRAVVLSGSRANPAAWRDVFQDYDITYLVTDVDSFVSADDEWIRPFGELMIIQKPEAMGDPPPAGDGTFAYLMQFTDGVRIDLTLCPVDKFRAESLAMSLLDKDGRLSLPPPSDDDFLPKRPTSQSFADCGNEFWWVAPYVAKGLARGEIIYAKHHLDEVMRRQLMRMLTWYVGVEAGFDRPASKHGKEFRRLLPHDMWTLLERTYAGPEEEENWEALFAMGELFRQAAHRVASEFCFEYPSGDDSRVTAHLRRVWVGEFGADDAS